MRDAMSHAARSLLMSKVRGRGNRSTEARVQGALVSRGLRGWVKHPAQVPGRPDFYFPRRRLALFVDGCFWHGCPRCARAVPRSRTTFWRNKLRANKNRDRRVGKLLRQQGYRVVRVWEHELANPRWFKRLQETIEVQVPRATMTRRRSTKA
jgi:DNA mismatch endonuclease, patch repair protein